MIDNLIRRGLNKFIEDTLDLSLSYILLLSLDSQVGDVRFLQTPPMGRLLLDFRCCQLRL